MAKRSLTSAPLAAALAASLLVGDTSGSLSAAGAGKHETGYTPLSCDYCGPLRQQAHIDARDPVHAHAPGAVPLMTRINPAGWISLAAHADDGPNDVVDVNTARAADGETIEVAVILRLPVKRDVVWAVLNDYENMPRFVPDILSARLIRSDAVSKRVAIEGVVHLLFMAFPIHTTLDVQARPDGTLAIHSVAGNLAIRATVRVQDEGSLTRVDYQARLVPDFWLPPLLGDYLIGRQVRRQFEGMVAEMHRRADRSAGGVHSDIPTQADITLTTLVPMRDRLEPDTSPERSLPRSDG